MEDNFKRIRIENTDIFLEDMGNNKGKITISDTYDHNYSYFWGSMGGNLEQFLLSINVGYFADKLMGYKSNNEMDVKKTFATVRKFIADEIALPWYEHMDFQKDMRERLKSFQTSCEENTCNNYFVSMFFSEFVNRLDFYLIEPSCERKRIEKEFNGISEHWYFIQDKPSREYLWLEKLHGQLVAKIKAVQSDSVERIVATEEATKN